MRYNWKNLTWWLLRVPILNNLIFSRKKKRGNVQADCHGVLGLVKTMRLWTSRSKLFFEPNSKNRIVSWNSLYLSSQIDNQRSNSLSRSKAAIIFSAGRDVYFWNAQRHVSSKTSQFLDSFLERPIFIRGGNIFSQNLTFINKYVYFLRFSLNYAYIWYLPWVVNISGSKFEANLIILFYRETVSNRLRSDTENF